MSKKTTTKKTATKKTTTKKTAAKKTTTKKTTATKTTKEEAAPTKTTDAVLKHMEKRFAEMREERRLPPKVQTELETKVGDLVTLTILGLNYQQNQ